LGAAHGPVMQMGMKQTLEVMNAMEADGIIAF
jgi:hypothetical protein